MRPDRNLTDPRAQRRRRRRSRPPQAPRRPHSSPKHAGRPASVVVPGESLLARADGGWRRTRVELDRVQRPVRLDHGERDVVLEGDGKREVQGAL